MNLDIIDIMFPAFVECLVLVGIHSYLGIHVIKRKVIFVDLSLAQIAALGTTVAFLFGIYPDSAGAYWFSLGFTFIGAAIFSLSRLRYEKIPQEAVIGLVYALAASVSILVVDKAPQGSEHIKEILTGSILWVKWKTIASASIIYALVGIFHFIFRNKFILISNNPEVAYQKGLNVRLWDFLFYLTFGIVITHSVRTAGVLLVFVFLVVPAIATIMITDRLWLQLLLGWTMGTVVSVFGLLVSYFADLPSGPTVVATYGFALLMLSLVLYIVRSSRRNLALRNLAMGISVFLITAFIFYGMGEYFQNNLHPHEESVRVHGHPSESQTESPPNNKITLLLELVLQIDEASNPLAKIEVLKKLINVDEKEGTKKAIELLEIFETPFYREEILDILILYSNTNFGYNSLKKKEENGRAVQRFREWWQDRYVSN
jgi:zinc/manganese transport system permease protein